MVIRTKKTICLVSKVLSMIYTVHEQSFTWYSFAAKQFPDNVPRRLTHSSETKRLLSNSLDHDENKYQRRTIAERINRWHV